MAGSGSAGNFQSIPALKPDQVPIPTTRGSVNMYMNLDDNLNIWTVDSFKVHRSVSPVIYNPAMTGLITVNQDGTSIDVNGNPANYTLGFRVSGGTAAYNIGETITNNVSLATGIIVAKTPLIIRLQNLTPGLWYLGDSITNGFVVKTITTTPPSWLIIIPATYKGKATFFGCNSNDNVNSVSNGTDGQTGRFAMYQNETGATPEVRTDINNSIFLQNIALDSIWFGGISNYSDSSFSVSVSYGIATGGGLQLTARYVTI